MKTHRGRKPRPTNGEFGSALRMFRINEGLSIRGLAKRSRISAVYLSQLERGEQNSPSITAVIRLERALNTKPGDLFRCLKDIKKRFAECKKIACYIEKIRITK